MGLARELSPDERADLLRRGFRSVEVWVPDLDSETLRQRLREEAARIAASDGTDDVTAWVAGVAPSNEDTP